jgi:3-oxoisoapionate decarboxylase
MRLGISSYTYTWAIGVPGHPPAQPLTIGELLDRAQTLGVEVVQLCENLSLARLPPKEREAVAQRAREAGLRLELGTRGLDLANLQEHLQLACQLSAPFVRLVIDTPGDEPTPAEVVQRLRPLAGEFRRAGVRLALENHDRFPVSVLAGLLESLGSDWTGICLDTVNSFGALEGPAVVVDALAAHTCNLHIKDFTISRVPSQMGFVVAGCPAGQGQLDVPGLFRRFHERQPALSAILELWTPWGPTLEDTLQREAAWAEASIRYLKTCHLVQPDSNAPARP